MALRRTTPTPTFHLAYLAGARGSRPKAAIDGFLKVHKGLYELLHKQYQVAIRKLAG